MIDHVSIAVSDLELSSRFFDRVLGAIGLARLVNRERTIGYGKRYPEFWLNLRAAMRPVEDGTGVHVALRAETVEAVAEFHRLALDGGGRSDGEPGWRQGEMIRYFGAFILDPDGNKIEAIAFERSGS